MTRFAFLWTGTLMVLSQVACSTETEQPTSANSPKVRYGTEQITSSKTPQPSASSKPVQSLSDQHDGHVRYYDTTDITTPAIQIDQIPYYVQQIQSRLDDNGVTLQDWSTGNRIQLDNLDWAGKYAVYISLSMERTHEEKDLILHSDTEEYRVVSVAHEPNSVIRVSASRTWKPKYSKISRESLQQRGIGNLLSVSSRWKQGSLNVLGDALGYLNEQEMSFMKDITFVRDASGSFQSQAGLYTFQEQDGVIEQRITLYDKAFQGMRHSFCGSIDAPKSAAHTVIIHEVGHMLANQPRVHLDRQYNALIDQYNATVTQFNQHNDPSLEKKLNTLNEQLQSMQQNQIQDSGPIVNAFLEHRSLQEGPTEYGNSSVDEAFAESFALFKLDPEALNRIDPKVYRWFDSGAYLDLLPKR